MANIAEIETKTAAPPAAEPVERRALPRWVITLISVSCLLILWEIFGRRVNPVFGSYPSAIALAFWELARSGELWKALFESLQPFFAGYLLAIVLGVPIGLLIGRFRTAEAALGIYVTAGYAMPLVALVPLLILWLGLGFKVKVAVVFLMSLFPICINTWLGVTAVPKTLIEVGKSFVASDFDQRLGHCGDAEPSVDANREQRHQENDRDLDLEAQAQPQDQRSEEHTSELQS